MWFSFSINGSATNIIIATTEEKHSHPQKHKSILFTKMSNYSFLHSLLFLIQSKYPILNSPITKLVPSST